MGHVQKRMSARLRKYKKDYKGIGGRNKLTAKMIDKLSVNYGVFGYSTKFRLSGRNVRCGQPLSIIIVRRKTNRNIIFVLKPRIHGASGNKQKRTNCWTDMSKTTMLYQILDMIRSIYKILLKRHY